MKEKGGHGRKCAFAHPTTARFVEPETKTAPGESQPCFHWCLRSGGLHRHMLEHVAAGLVVHLGLELEVILQRDRLCRRRTVP